MPRGPKRQRATLVLACLGFVLQDPPARADPSTPARAPALRLEYAAPGNCPTEADFEAGVLARTAFARFANEGDAQAVRVVVRPTGVTYAGHLSIVGRSGRVSERDVEDTLCSDVVDALALVTALAVDPNATLTLPARAGQASSPPLLAPPLDASSPESPAPPTAPASPSPTPAPAESRVAPRGPTPASAPRWAGGAGASFTTIAGIAPDALAGGGVFGEIESRSRGILAPSVRLLVFAAENGVFRARTASFVLVAARPDVCPVRLGSRDLSIRACVGADVGALYAEGIQVTHRQLAVVGWFDAALLLRARWAPGRGSFFVEAGGGILVPVTRPSFRYEESTGAFARPDVDDPWDVGAFGSIDAGLRFW